MPELDLGRVTGKSAYEYAVDGGYPGTEAEFQALLAKMGDTPEKIEFQLSEGWSARYGGSPYRVNARYFCKSADGLITLSLDAYRPDFVKGRKLLGVLPEGYRPKVDIGISAVDVQNLKAISVDVNPNGEVHATPIVTGDVPAEEIEYRYVRFTLSFYP